ncbi:phospholipase B [Amylostereum chailletii]|nr:phospholipase B [Amylostereum chailletii]
MSSRIFLTLLLGTIIIVGSCVCASTVEDYAPITNVACPNVSTHPLIRTFSPTDQSLHPDEEAYINAKNATILPDQWRAWLGDGSAIGYNLSVFEGHLPRISISISGGGERAALYGAGVISGIDARNESAKAAGTGGLLQVASYMSGLSGGSWVTGSMYMNNWPNVSDLVFGNGNDLSGWLLDLNLVSPHGTNVFDDENQAFYLDIVASIKAKIGKAFQTSITDTWARAISYHFLNSTSRNNFYSNDSGHGTDQLWSRIPQNSAYQQHIPPFPILVADSRPVGSNATNTPLEYLVYEITPLEFGSWDPDLSAMVNTSFIGTQLKNGQPDNDTACVTGFDEAGFMMGTSASLFNVIFDSGTTTLDGLDSSDTGGWAYALGEQLTDVRNRSDDVSNWPNPFQGLRPSTFPDADQPYLDLVDGGLNLENIPLGPMFVKARGMDFIVAVDGSYDTDKTWPNGTAIVNTAERLSTILNSTHQPFPPRPSTMDDFVSTGFNSRPTFFGCDPTQNPPEWPLVLYLPNSPPIDGSRPSTNSATLKLSYTLKHVQIFLDQVHNTTIHGFTPDSKDPDPNWGKCLQCGAIDRARYKTTPVTLRSTFCSACFTQYCYDPSNPPNKSQLVNRDLDYYDPDPETTLGRFFQQSFGIIAGIAAGVAVLIGAIISLLCVSNPNLIPVSS